MVVRISLKIVGALLFSVAANALSITDADIQGLWYAEINGCQSTSLEDRIKEVQASAEKAIYRHKLYFFDKVMVQEQTFNMYCALSQQSVVDSFDGKDLVATAEYGQATGVCREPFKQNLGPKFVKEHAQIRLEWAKSRYGDYSQPYLIYSFPMEKCGAAPYEIHFARPPRPTGIIDPAEIPYMSAAMGADNGVDYFQRIIESNFQGSVDYYNTEYRVSDDGKTPLMVAAETGDIEMVKILLAAGASVLAKNASQESAESLAEKNGHKEIVELLKEARVIWTVPQ